MALSIVNTNVPNLSWRRKSLPNNSVFEKPKISSTRSKRCDHLQIKALNIVSSEDEIKSTEYSWDDKPHNSFPSDFTFGAATSAFQVEGATKDGGRGPSIWDTFCEKFPDKIAGKATGDPGAGSYHLYKDDVKLLADIGLNAYRFSISWSRVLPKGRDQRNEEGINYYHKLIDELLTYGIEPYITLFHWDVPQALEDEYGGFLSRKIVKDYKNYVELCFKEYGHKVKHWITMNEPSMFCSLGYSFGMHAPGHCTPDLQVNEADFICPTGDSLREPYKVAHNILLAHAEAVELYKNKYKATQGGQVGITLVSNWFEAYDNSPLNREAQQRALDFKLGWFLDPLKFGDYPFSMRALVGDRLPIFTPEESAKLKGCFDFIGLNYYTASYAQHKPYNYTDDKRNTIEDDSYVNSTDTRGDLPIGPSEEGSWVKVYPKGLKKLLLHIKERYNNPTIYITENGVLEYTKERLNEELQTTNLPTEDDYRTEYHTSHLHELEEALNSGARVKGYFVWSLLDSFEWYDGYQCRFGLVYINYDNLDRIKWQDLKRTPKQSAKRLKQYLSKINRKQPVQLSKEEAPPVIAASNNL